MCYISVILKKAEDHSEEFKIRLSSSQLISLETPYYVVVEIGKETLSLSYAYSDNSINTSETQIDDVKITYGDNTGRVFLIIAHFGNNGFRCINLNDISIEGWNEIKSNNLKLGILIYNTILGSIQFRDCR